MQPRLITMGCLRPVCVVLLLIFGTSLRAQPPAVAIKQQPVKIKRHTFNPRRPPAAMPKLTPPESGVCHFEFGADTGIGCDVETIDARTVEVEVTNLDTILTLDIDIWTKIGAPKKLIAHEEGHRKICEHYYKAASAIARRLGTAMIGRKAKGTGRNKQEAVQNAQQKLLTELNLAYMNETRVRCSACQVIYDKITNHSLIPIDESIAITQAVAQENQTFNNKAKAASL
jgi:hypothetical protein